MVEVLALLAMRTPWVVKWEPAQCHFLKRDWNNGYQSLLGSSLARIGLFQTLQVLPGWSWNPREDQWNECYQHLLRFVTEHNHARVPAAYQDADGFRLGQWVTGQRSAHAKGTLRAERRKKFQELPGWSWTPR